MATKFLHTELLKLLKSQNIRLDRFYAQKARELAYVLAKHKVRNTKDIWRGNKGLEREVNRILKAMDSEFVVFLERSLRQGIALNNLHRNQFIEDYLRGAKLTPDAKLSIIARSAFAAGPWIADRIKSFNISNRVWNLQGQTKEQIEYFLAEGLAEGRSAQKLATDLKKYLKEPDKRFRRVRDKNGKLILSAPAKNYRPGQGVYRSSYKNALRLARNEVNIAYRYNDYQRIQKLDFVLGIKVNLSPSHPRYDICDELQGKYPKGFKFIGWHPNCLCYTTSLLMPQEDFVKKLNGERYKAARIRKMPKRAEKFLNSNADKIKSRKSKPYFISDNLKSIKDGFELKKSVQ